MRSKFTSFGLLFIALALFVTLPGATAGDGQSGGGLGFGQRIAGTYFSNDVFGGTLTLYADGNVSALSGQCCGNAPNIQSEAYGNWVRTGPKQIELRTVVVGTAHDWPVGPTGNFVATPAEVLDFADDFQSFTGSLCTSVWNYDLGFQQMPDIEVVPPDFIVGPFPVAMSRLAVFVECPD